MNVNIPITRQDAKRPAAGLRSGSPPEAPRKGRAVRAHSSRTRAKNAQAGAWAARLAQCRNRETGEPQVAHPGDLLDDNDAPWALFDAARTSANAALAQAGLVERITLHVTGTERCYCLVDADGEARKISISVTVRRVAGRYLGGAFIRLGRTHLPIYVVPEIHDEHLRWLVAAGGTEFTAGLVHDLFLSVFGDDAAATFRLSPLAGADLFQTP